MGAGSETARAKDADDRDAVAKLVGLEIDGVEVTFRYSGDSAPGVGGIVRLADPLVPEVVLLHSIGFQFGQPDFNGLKYGGQRLPASQQAFVID